MQSIAAEIRTRAPRSIEVFEYPAGPEQAIVSGWESWEEAPRSDPARDPETSHLDEAKLRAEFDRRLGEETRRACEAGREKGCQEGRALEREAHAAGAAKAEERRALQAVELVESFRQERERYFGQVEREVVGLALAIAARVLRREAQMDPLLLTGAVRVALGQLAAATAVRIKVPPAEMDLWTENLSLLPNLAVKPEVVAGEGMRMGDCAIETEMGSADLGIRAQLGEIERGFFDRGEPSGSGQLQIGQRLEREPESRP